MREKGEGVVRPAAATPLKARAAEALVFVLIAVSFVASEGAPALSGAGQGVSALAAAGPPALRAGRLQTRRRRVGEGS